MGSIDLNQWNHFALSRKGGSFRSFKNGAIVSTIERPELFVRVSSDSLQIGKGQGGNFFEGFIDGLVITRGTAKYFDAFTPSTSAPTATTANKTYTGSHYMESAYKTLKTVCTTLDAEFKIQNDGTIDVGPSSSLFTGHGNSTPTGIIVRRLSGPDPEITGYSGIDLTTEFNAEDFVSRVELIASNYGAEINLGQADEKNNPYKDLHGNELERIQILSENDIPDSMRDIRAEAYLNEYNKIQKTLNVGLENYDVSGDIVTGDVIFVYDPDVGFEDTTNDATLENRSRHEVTYQGQILHPIKIRVMGLSFPIVDTMGVFYRDGDGTYTDLTDYVDFEVGTTQIEVGTTKKQINQDLRGSASVIAISGSNELSVPDAPTGLAVAKGSYQDGSGRPFAFARLTWNEPTNTDGSRITDGNMYRVRYRQVTDVDGNNLIDSNDNQVTDYEYLTVEFGTQAVVIKGLGPNNTYEFGVACIDNSGFSGGFAVITASQMPNDAVAPPEPTPPTGTFGSVASSAALVQIQHKLGAAKTVSGATINSPSNFTLPRDIDHLNVYRGTASNFTISATNFVGEIQARAGHIDGNITAIGSFQNSTQGTAFYKVTAVDVAGNESTPSTAAQVTEELIDTAFINDAAITTLKVGDAQITDAKIDTLTASKITAGTISGKEIIVDTDSATDPSNPVLGKIRSKNYSSGSAGWIINSDGSVEFSSGTFRGDITGASGTFSGSLSAGVSISAPAITGGTISGTSGTFTGDISGASGTFTGDLTGADITGGTINIGSGTFQVSNAGAITATSGTIGGISLGSTSISSSNFSGSSQGFQITSAGAATFNSVTVNNPVITLNSASSSSESNVSDSVLGIGGARIYENSNDLYLRGTSIVLQDSNGGTEANPSVTFSTSFDNPGFYAENDNSNTQAKLFWSSGSNNIIHSESDSDVLYIDAANVAIGTDTGGANEFIGKNSSGQLGWHTVSSASHTHTESDISNIGAHNHSIGEISGHGSHLSLGASGGINGSSGNAARFDHSHSGVGSHSHTANDVTGTISVTSVSSGGFVNSLSYNNSNKTLTVAGSNTRNANISTRTHTPTSNLSYNLGGFGQVWATVFRNSESTGSDERLKNSIEDIDKGLNFIKDLQPRKFKWNNDSIGFFCDVCDVDLEDASDTCDTEDCEGTSIERFTMESERDKWQYGFIAQELLTNLDSNTGYGIANYDETDDNYFYSPNNLVAVLTKAVQELSAKNDELESRLTALEG